jgi:hypothetical protein
MLSLHERFTASSMTTLVKSMILYNATTTFVLNCCDSGCDNKGSHLI